MLNTTFPSLLIKYNNCINNSVEQATSLCFEVSEKENFYAVSQYLVSPFSP